jgi:hypothetical protein
MDDGNSEYWKDAMKHWQRMFAQARECLQEAMARGAKADDGEMLAKWDATQRKEIYTANAGLHRTEPAAGSGTVRGLVGGDS